MGVSPPDLGDDIELFLSRWLRQPVLVRTFSRDLSGAALRAIVHANVIGFSQSADGRVTGAIARTLGGRAAYITARRIVLACGTIEIARLLAKSPSTDSRAPWSTNPWLGRGFIDHLNCDAGSVSVIDKKGFHDIFDNIYVDGLKYSPRIRFSDAAQRKTGSLQVAANFVFKSDYREHLDSLKLFLRSVLTGRRPQALRGLPGHLAALWGVAGPLTARYLRSGRSFNPTDRGIDLNLKSEQWPHLASRIVFENVVDVLGLPKALVDWQFDGRELESMANFAERVRVALLNCGLADVELNPLLLARDPAFLDAATDEYHQMGGARIGESARDGVVDADLRVHGAENLYVAGAAVFPSSGFANPTFTAMALGLRLSDHLVRGSGA
jgi:hypothetical protein